MWNNNNSNMHGSMDIGPNVPAFLVKLWKLVEDPECDLIYWSESGMSFIIVAQARFAREVLPLHYKHNNMASFIRQLNMYDFHKVSSAESGGLKTDKDETEFAHQYFIKNHPYLLENIKRKMSNSRSGGGSGDNAPTTRSRSPSQSDIFARLLQDVNMLKAKQETWEARLTAMKRENEALWRELAIFRQKHMKQEQIINKLIHFIVTILQPSRKPTIPRRYPLMLNGTQEERNASNLNRNNSSPVGPSIHEIDGDVLIGGNEANSGDVLIGGKNVRGRDVLIGGKNVRGRDVLIGGNNVRGRDVLIGGNNVSGSDVLIGGNNVTGSDVLIGGNNVRGGDVLIGGNNVRGSDVLIGGNNVTGSDVLIGGNNVTGSDVLIGGNNVRGGDVLIGGNEVNEPSALENDDFITTGIRVEPSKPEVTNDPVLSSSKNVANKNNPSDWLEIVLTEEDLVTPLTPVDPTEVNPVVAAATLKHMENNNKITIPITMKIPPIITSDGKKKAIPEKKIIYLAEIPTPEKTTKKRQNKQIIPKNGANKNKGLLRPKASTAVVKSGNKNLASAGNGSVAVSKNLPVPVKTAASGKRKLPNSSPLVEFKIPNKQRAIEATPTIEAASEYSSPFQTPNTLENFLTYNTFDLEAIDSEEITTTKQTTIDDPFWKLESLYNDSLGVNELITEVDEAENPIDEDPIVENPIDGNSIDENVGAEEDFILGNKKKTTDVVLCDVNTSDIELPRLSDRNDEESNDSIGDFPSEALAIVRQSPSSASEELTRELTSHVENVQGEIDYLKEVLKGEGYNLEMNNILGYFNEDPLAYGLLPPTEEPKEKEADKGIAGNEVISYGTPTNLMELVDLFGSTGTVQDWSNISSPTSPTVSDLITPASSPSPAASKSGKRRK